MLVAGTAASVGLAFLNEQGRLGSRSNLQPAMAEARSSASVATPSTHGVLAASRDAVTRRVGHATLIGIAALVVAAAIPAAIALFGNLGSPRTAESAVAGTTARPAPGGAAAGSGWEDAYAAAVPSASDRGAALIAGAAEQRKIDTLIALDAWGKREAAAKTAAAAKNQTLQAASAPARGAAQSLGRASGYGAGAVLLARITIYGCVGSGGGFCGGMASGIKVFEGAAACSSDMAFGTKFTIAGDPTGRTYECLDRGHLSSPWVDVFFYDTADGFAWASQLGSTSANITIVN